MTLAPCSRSRFRPHARPRSRAGLGALCLALGAAAGLPLPLQAQTAASIAAPAELAQAEALIEALVQRGLLPRVRADVLIREARTRAGVMPVVPAAPAAPPRAAASAATRESTRQPARGETSQALQRLRAELKEELRAEVRDEVQREVRDDLLARADALVQRAASTAPTTTAAATTTTAMAAARGASPAAPAAHAFAPAPPAPLQATAAQAVPTPLSPSPAPAPAPAPSPPPPPPPPPPAQPAANVVRVPYVPQVVRDQIRNQLRDEVLAAARTEQWGKPAVAAVPAWTQRISIEGDMRLRWQVDAADGGNLAPVELLASSFGRVTRAADLAAGTRDNVALGNTQEDRERWRLRARLGINARINDQTVTGLRLATGSATDRVSTNQTLGQNANRYSFLLDRAFVRWDPAAWASISAGRIANPWFATDLQWSENLAFEGVAAQFRLPAAGGRFEPFLTLGYFPLREDAPPTPSRALSGVQIGLQMDFPSTRVRLGLAQYNYSGLAGQIDDDYDPVLRIAGPSYGRFEYGAALRQRGNTLFLTNNPGEGTAGADLTPDRFRWGLASRFTPVALTVAAELSHFAPQVLLLSAEVVQNTAFDRQEIENRTGLRIADGSSTGLALRAVFGAPAVQQRGQWQFSLGWRRLGSDAVLDAFTDSDLRLGGTNLTGFSAGLLWGLERDLSLGLRVLQGRSLAPMAVQPGVEGRRGDYGIRSMQVDLGARF